MLRSHLVRLLVPGLALVAAGAARAAVPSALYRLSPAHSVLTYTFTQAGAANHGRFKSFTARFDPGTKQLSVVIDMRSFDTGDAQRNSILGSAAFFDVARYPQARFTAASLRKTSTGYIATGPLTLRGTTRTVSVPFTWHIVRVAGHEVGLLDGSTVIKRLDFGVGQGEWRATEWLGNAVAVHFSFRMVPSSH